VVKKMVIIKVKCPFYQQRDSKKGTLRYWIKFSRFMVLAIRTITPAQL